MKVYVHIKRKVKDKQMILGVSYYTDKGKHIKSHGYTDVLKDKKFDSYIKGIRDTISLLKKFILEQGVEEGVTLFMDTKNVFLWLSGGNVPIDYAKDVTDLEEELSFFPVPLEILYFKDTVKRIKKVEENVDEELTFAKETF